MAGGGWWVVGGGWWVAGGGWWWWWWWWWWCVCVYVVCVCVYMGSQEQTAFETGHALVESTAVYRLGYNFPTRVQTDALEHGVGSRI